MNINTRVIKMKSKGHFTNQILKALSTINYVRISLDVQSQKKVESIYVCMRVLNTKERIILT